MKFSLLVLLCAVVAFAAADDDDHVAFKAFQAQFGRKYRSANVESERFANFRKARAAIALHNAAFARGEETYSAGINQFADMTEAEFKSTSLGAELPAHLRKREAAASSEEAESTLNLLVRQSPIDLRTYYPIVHNQGQCGSCWTFSATTAMEISTAAQGKGSELLAQQYFVDCVNDGTSHGCNGGWPTSVWNLVNSTRGCTTQAYYPYTGSATSACKRSATLASKIKAVTYRQLTAAQIPAALSSKQACACALQANQALSRYAGGTFTDSQCNGISTNTINHAITIVGQTANQYIVQNSWGTSWGDKGYFYVNKGANTCNIESHCYAVSVSF